MKEIPLTLPEIGMINGTRFVIGTGVGLSLAGRVDRNTRKAVGVSLLVAGVFVFDSVGMVVPRQATKCSLVQPANHLGGAGSLIP